MVLFRTTFYSIVFVYCLVIVTVVLILQKPFDFSYSEESEWKPIRKEDCSCYGRRNCFSHSSDRDLCGECFSTCWKDSVAPNRSKETAFATSATPEGLDKLLVYIASLHKFYPTVPIIVYAIDDKKKSIAKKLKGVRKVQVFESSAILSKISTPWLSHLMLDALNKFENVAWTASKVEFLRNDLKLDEKSWKKPITYMKAEVTNLAKSEYHRFFPASDWVRNKPLLVYLKQRSRKFLEWATLCGLDEECSSCYDDNGKKSDCTLEVLQTLATMSADDIDFAKAHPKYFEVQSWSMPECGLFCAIGFIGLIIATVIFVIAVVLRNF